MDVTNRQLVLVDLDRTLFDLDKFFTTIWRTLGDMYGFNAQDALDHMREFYYRPKDGYHGTYAFGNHLHVFVPDADEHATIQLLVDRLRGTSFLFDDASVLFEWAKRFDVRILSFGESHIQEFKLAFCPELAVIPTELIMERKTEYIAEHYAGRHGFLVDDKLELGLPEGMRQIWIVRDPHDPRLENKPKSDIILVNSLKQANEFL